MNGRVYRLALFSYYKKDLQIYSLLYHLHGSVLIYRHPALLRPPGGELHDKDDKVFTSLII